MKKTLMALCGAFALAAFAEPEAAADAAACKCGADCKCAKAENCDCKKAPERKARQRPERPLVLNIDAATPEQIEQFKKDVLARIDKAVAEKPAEEKCACGKDDCKGGPDCKCGDEKCNCADKRGPRSVVLFVNNGMRPRHMGGRGPGGKFGPGMRRGPGDRRGPKGGAPDAPAPEAPASEAK